VLVSLLLHSSIVAHFRGGRRGYMKEHFASHLILNPMDDLANPRVCFDRVTHNTGTKQALKQQRQKQAQKQSVKLLKPKLNCALIKSKAKSEEVAGTLKPCAYLANSGAACECLSYAAGLEHRGPSSWASSPQPPDPSSLILAGEKHEGISIKGKDSFSTEKGVGFSELPLRCPLRHI